MRRPSSLLYLAYSAAFLAFSCAETTPPVAAPTTASSSTNPHDELRTEIRRREEADIDSAAHGHGDRHPERLVLRAELESLRAADKAWTPNGGPREVRLALLRATEAGLLAAGRGENHPDVVAVRAKISAEASP